MSHAARQMTHKAAGKIKDFFRNTGLRHRLACQHEERNRQHGKGMEACNRLLRNGKGRGSTAGCQQYNRQRHQCITDRQADHQQQNHTCPYDGTHSIFSFPIRWDF